MERPERRPVAVGRQGTRLQGRYTGRVCGKLYENALKKGAFLLAVETRDSESTKQVKDILKNANAKDVTAVAA